MPPQSGSTRIVLPRSSRHIVRCSGAEQTAIDSAIVCRLTLPRCWIYRRPPAGLPSLLCILTLTHGLLTSLNFQCDRRRPDMSCATLQWYRSSDRPSRPLRPWCHQSLDLLVSRLQLQKSQSWQRCGKCIIWTFPIPLPSPVCATLLVYLRINLDYPHNLRHLRLQLHMSLQH